MEDDRTVFLPEEESCNRQTDLKDIHHILLEEESLYPQTVDKNADIKNLNVLLSVSSRYAQSLQRRTC